MPKHRDRHRHLAARRRGRGFTLIDVLVLIVLLGTVAGSMTVLFSRLAAQSAQTLRAQQALALALALLEEVRAMPMSYCDPQDANAATATGAFVGPGGCAATVESLGPEPGEQRSALPAQRYDNVGDYHNLVMPGPACAGGICEPGGTLINPAGTPLAGCGARIVTTPQAMPGIAALDAWGRPQGLRIVVTITCPGLADTAVEGLRLRHSPRQV
jgi:MSHA pilin protein MshD